MNTVDYIKIYLCYLCKSRADKNGYIQLNIYGKYRCPHCDTTYDMGKLLVYKDTSLMISLTPNRNFSS